MKVAVTFLTAFMVTVQLLPVALSQPLQAAKLEPFEAVAVSVTLVPLAKLLLQLVPQEMPVGELTTMPSPLPALATTSE